MSQYPNQGANPMDPRMENQGQNKNSGNHGFSHSSGYGNQSSGSHSNSYHNQSLRGQNNNQSNNSQQTSWNGSNYPNHNQASGWNQSSFPHQSSSAQGSAIPFAQQSVSGGLVQSAQQSGLSMHSQYSYNQGYGGRSNIANSNNANTWSS